MGSGFCRNIHLSKDVFTCDSCGETPQYIVADGKVCGPQLRKVQQLKELDRADDDQEPLGQGSDFKHRVFLSDKEERTLVKNLVTERIDIDEFLHENLVSDHGQLIHQLVRRLSDQYGDVPRAYSLFIGDIAKYTSVSGYMQCTGPRALRTLQVCV